MVKNYTDLWKWFLGAIGIYFASQLTTIYIPIMLAIVIAFILNPFVNWLCEVFPLIGRGSAVLLAFLCMLIVFSGIGMFVLIPFIHEFDNFMINVPILLAKIQTTLEALQHNTWGMPWNVNLMLDRLLDSVTSLSTEAARNIFNTLVGMASRIIELIVVPVLTFYFLRDGRLLRDKFINLYSIEKRPKVQIVLAEFAKVISGYIHGQAWISSIIGLLVFAGMYLLGVDYPMVWGLLATCTEMIPIIGPIIGAIPAIILAYLVSPALAVKVIVFYIVIHQLENHIIVPNVMGHVIELHPVLVIISLLIGGKLLGIMGMIIAVPAAALLKVLLQQFWLTER
jgi:predicted PurR-regulated permease PerM